MCAQSLATRQCRQVRWRICRAGLLIGVLRERDVLLGELQQHRVVEEPARAVLLADEKQQETNLLIDTSSDNPLRRLVLIMNSRAR